MQFPRPNKRGYDHDDDDHMIDFSNFKKPKIPTPFYVLGQINLKVKPIYRNSHDFDSIEKEVDQYQIDVASDIKGFGYVHFYYIPSKSKPFNYFFNFEGLVDEIDQIPILLNSIKNSVFDVDTFLFDLNVNEWGNESIPDIHKQYDLLTYSEKKTSNFFIQKK